MKLKSTVIKNYRGIKEETLVSFQDFNCIVGKNDVGKSTLLKAIDAFLNENNPNIEDKNVYSDSNFIEINLILILRQVQLFWMILFRYHFLMKN
ncbi:AAA family ATPase [Alistipes shahii]|jgi:putative ATP-dependent endonuclease of OLD family|uniref:AAA family ATPase n=1 Tax=Alistipes shahii TaxID=328814 RepID=UPI00266B83AE|nr:AAA family ATPase [Alistipes shahii]